MNAFRNTHPLRHKTYYRRLFSLLGRILCYILLTHKWGRLGEEPTLKLMISEKPWLRSNDLESQKQQPGNREQAELTFPAPRSRSTRQRDSPFKHPEERRTSSNTSYTTKIHLPVTRLQTRWNIYVFMSYVKSS